MNFQTIFACVCLIAAATSSVIPLEHLGQSNVGTVSNECKLRLALDLGRPQPLYLRPDNGQFYMPKSNTGRIELDRNGNINIHCPGGFQGKFSSHKEETIATTCIGGTQFLAVNSTTKFDDIRCLRAPPHEATPTSKACHGGKIVEVGFKTESQFMSLYTVCHDEREAATRWVHYTQRPENKNHQHGIGRIDFATGDFYKGISPSKLYQRPEQTRTLAKLLGSEKLAADLIKPAAKNEFFLARGHLAAKSDFIFDNHQKASFYYINAAPQWQTFNGGNWAILEERLKSYVAKNNMNTEIWTGTYGIVTYKDTDGVHQKFYLSSEAGSRQIPVPKVFYKVVIDIKNKAGIAFVGINNPYATMEDIKQNYTFCNDVMNKVTYIPWKKNLEKGHLYACEVNEFAKAIGDLPVLPATNRLLL